MKFIIFVLCFICFLCSASATQRSAGQVLSKLHLNSESSTALISSAQDLTGSWADLGSEIALEGRDMIGLFFAVDINSSASVRIRVNPKHSSGHADEFDFVSITSSSTSSVIAPHYYQLTNNQDDKYFLSWSTDKLIPYVQFQVMVGSTGLAAPISTEGQIDSAVYTLGWK